MKIYHYPGECGAAFCEALADYLITTRGRAPASVLKGLLPGEKKGPHGKPYFYEPEFEGVFFSRSDTRGYKTIGFSDGEIGVDCENTEGRPGIESRFLMIAKRYFSEDELGYLEPGASGAAGRFFEIWTAKEAYMKFTGKGFSEGFRSFSVFGLPDAVVETGRVEGAPHIVYSVCTERRTDNGDGPFCLALPSCGAGV